MDESNIYKLGISYDDGESDDSVEEVHNDDDLTDFQQTKSQTKDKPPRRPPPISTDWDAGKLDMNDLDERLVAQETPPLNRSSARPSVSFSVPLENNTAANDNKYDMIAGAATTLQTSSTIHFQNPKPSFTTPYPTQSLRRGAPSDLLELEEVSEENIGKTHDQIGEEVTPAFLRRAAQELGVANAASMGVNNSNIVPPNSLMNRRDRQSNNNDNNNITNTSLPDSSFYGADASALDGTFVSIRDLDDNDDVPSVDNDQWNSTNNTNNDGKQGDSDAGFPTETTSLLGDKHNKMLAWQGGFFGSQMEKEDRKERRKMMMRERKGWVSGWIWTVQSLLWSVLPGKKSEIHHANGSSSRGAGWEANHPIGGGGFASSRTNSHYTSGLARRQRLFSLFMIGALCSHMALCGLHDLFLRYISYRNPNEYDEESEVGWNGEGQYIPAYWMSSDGRVLNPLVGPGARTLTAFGALVPGLVLSKGQWWRVVTSIFETSSFIQLILHIWALKTVVGGDLMGLEWRRGTFTVVSLYLICAIIGSMWTIAVEPGRLITASGMGIAGLLAATIIERACFPLASKDEDEADTNNPYNGRENGSNAAISSSSNEQFSFQPPSSTQKKKRRSPLSNDSPALLLLLEILASWWAAYASLAGTVVAATMGAAGALLLFVGRHPPGSFDRNANQDLLFTEETAPPPPPPPIDWRDDDDSADSSPGRPAFNTPMMRRSILPDDDDEEEPLGTRSSLRKRNVGSSAKTPVLNGHTISIKNKQSFNASRVIGRLVGVLLALLLTIIPLSLIATGEGPSAEVTRASVLGCRPMRILYKEDDNSDVFECAGGCIPFSRERTARRSEGMKLGRCDTIGYRCFQQTGTMTLRNYEVNVGIYVVPSAEGACGNADGDGGGEENNNNDDANNANKEEADAYNGEVEGAE